LGAIAGTAISRFGIAVVADLFRLIDAAVTTRGLDGDTGIVFCTITIAVTITITITHVDISIAVTTSRPGKSIAVAISRRAIKPRVRIAVNEADNARARDDSEEKIGVLHD